MRLRKCTRSERDDHRKTKFPVQQPEQMKGKWAEDISKMTIRSTSK